MKIEFNGSHITNTHNFESRDWELGVPWCTIESGTH